MKLVSFTPESGESTWQPIGDGVLGGRSSGAIACTETGIGEVHGTVRLDNGGGFASVKRDLPEPTDASGCRSVILSQPGGARPSTRASMRRNLIDPGKLLSLAILASATLPGLSRADLMSVAWDNDLMTGSDRGYTNGLMISYLTAAAQDQDSPSSGLARAARNKLDFLPGLSTAGHEQALAFSIRQLMLTPANIEAVPPDTDGLPYAGYLDASATLWSWSADTITGYGAHLGIIGPESGAEASQKWVHKLTGSEDPKGWDYQLGTDVVAGIQGTHARKLIQHGSSDQLQQQVSVIGSANLSSFRTSARIGSVWRIGQNLPVNFLPDYAGSASTIGLPGALGGSAPGWSVFIGLGLEAVPYSYLDKNSAPYQFDESLFQGQAGIGGTMHWDKLLLSLILRATTGEEQTNKENFSYGSLSVTWAL